MLILTTHKTKFNIQEELKQEFPEIHFEFCTSMTEARPFIPQADVLVTYGEDITEKILHNANNLKWIHVNSAGVDKLPAKSISERNIHITNVSGIHKVPMSEYTIMMMITVMKKAKQLFNNQRNNEWNRKYQFGEISGQTVGVLGTGAIGSEIARLAKAFHMKTIGLSSDGRSVEYFDETYASDHMMDFLPEVDFLVSVLPSTPATEKFLKFEHFAKMPNHSTFINIGRGNTVKEDDLLEALQKNEIGHAVLDVMETEPLSTEHPFWKMENVTITPHMSGLSPKYQPRAFEIFKENLAVYLNGEGQYKNVVNLERGY